MWTEVGETDDHGRTVVNLCEFGKGENRTEGLGYKRRTMKKAKKVKEGVQNTDLKNFVNR